MLYYSSACEEKVCAHCDEAGDCVKDGNFRGVCPVIGRLNCFLASSVYRCARKKGSASVGHFSWLGVIRTAARTKQFDRTQTLRKLST